MQRSHTPAARVVRQLPASVVRSIQAAHHQRKSAVRKAAAVPVRQGQAGRARRAATLPYPIGAAAEAVRLTQARLA